MSLLGGIDRIYVTKIYDNLPISISNIKGIAVINAHCTTSITQNNNVKILIHIGNLLEQITKRRTNIICAERSCWMERMQENLNFNLFHSLLC